VIAQPGSEVLDQSPSATPCRPTSTAVPLRPARSATAMRRGCALCVNPSIVQTLSGNSLNDAFVSTSNDSCWRARAATSVYAAASYTLPTGVDTLIMEAHRRGRQQRCGGRRPLCGEQHAGDDSSQQRKRRVRSVRLRDVVTQRRAAMTSSIRPELHATDCVIP